MVADVPGDIDDLTNEQVLLLAPPYFGMNPLRYYGCDPGTVHRVSQQWHAHAERVGEFGPAAVSVG